MSARDDKRLSRYLDGFAKAGDMQAPPGPDGDPQLTALTQYLQTLVDALGPEDVLLDIGSGLGVLAHKLLQIWPDDGRRPWYFAIDLEDALDRLSLPHQIHNHSRKALFDDFLGGSLPCEPRQIKVTVLRNVVHELNIRLTAEVLVALRRIARAGGQVYLQDIVSLPTGERANAGWPRDLFSEVLSRAGFDCGSPADYRSRSGTEWFTMVLKDKAGSPVPSISQATRLVAEGREKQRQRQAARLTEIGDSTEETVTEYIMLSAEVSALTTQLLQTQYGAAGEAARAREVADLPLATLPASPLDYAEAMSSSVRARSGLSAVLSSKNLLDLPALLRRAIGRLWFAGYSQRLLFTIPEVRAALMDAVKRGVDIRILLVDPDSPAAHARSASEAYAKPGDFFDDVLMTAQGYDQFKEELIKAVGDSAEVRCDLRLCPSLLSSSYFFVDDLCICSLYSANLTGGSGGTFVFESSTVQPNGYFQVLLREFQSAWKQCER